MPERLGIKRVRERLCKIDGINGTVAGIRGRISPFVLRLYLLETGINGRVIFCHFDCGCLSIVDRCLVSYIRFTITYKHREKFFLRVKQFGENRLEHRGQLCGEGKGEGGRQGGRSKEGEEGFRRVFCSSEIKSTCHHRDRSIAEIAEERQKNWTEQRHRHRTWPWPSKPLRSYNEIRGI